MKIKDLSMALLCAICGGFVAVFTYSRIVDNGENISQAETAVPYHLAAYEPQKIRDVSYPDLTFAAEKAVYCVVHVKVKSMESIYGSLFDYFYGRRQQVPREGYGSGVIVSDDGYIITNNHVVKSSEEIEVALNDKRVFTARLVGTDPSTDLALLKIEENNLPFLTFGDSEAMRVGEWVLAVGNPYNLTSTVTAGIISAKARYLGINSRHSQMEIESFIQTDAAVNQGNSGGALVNIRGELIGINSLIISPSGAFSGSSFAIPATIVQKVMSDLKEFGVVQRALLGVGFTVRGEDNFANKDKEELCVASFTEKSSAADAGIKIGDVITAINDVAISTYAELQEQLSKYRPNDNVKVSVNRDKKTQHFNVILRNIEGTTQILQGDNSGSSLGATFEQVSQKEKQSAGIKSGVRVRDVGQGQLKSVGIRNGFIVTSVNDKSVNSAKDIQTIVDAVDIGGRIVINGVNSRGDVSYYVFAKKGN
jgi:Do/DeqQ family serine protease